MSSKIASPFPRGQCIQLFLVWSGYDIVLKFNLGAEISTTVWEMQKYAIEKFNEKIK